MISEIKLWGLEMKMDRLIQRRILAASILILGLAGTAQADVIETVAGGGSSYDSNIPALSAQLNTPFDVEVDDAGNYFISDHSNSRICKVDAEGILTVVAGGGSSIESGIPARDASIGYPLALSYLRFNGKPYLYLIDRSNARACAVDLDAQTLYSIYNSTSGVGGIQAFESGGKIYVYITDGSGNLVGLEMTDPVTPNTTNVLNPTGATYMHIYRDSGNIPWLLVSEYGAGTVARYDISNPLAPGDRVHVAGGGADYTSEGIPADQAYMTETLGVERDQAGNFYVVEHSYWTAPYGNRVRKIDIDGNIWTVAGTGVREFTGDGGPAIDATFRNPTGISLDLYGDLLIGDDWNHRIRWVNFKPHAAFAPTPDRGFSPLAVTFANTTRTASGTTYSWIFGDGTSSTEVSPVHSYTKKGLNPVVLTAVGLSGLLEDTTQATGAVSVSYIFSNMAETGTTAPFTRSYLLNGKLYCRVWANRTEVDWTRLSSATLTVKQGKKTLTVNLLHEGNGNFSGSLTLSSSTFLRGSAAATFTIKDKNRKVFTATENIVIQ